MRPEESYTEFRRFLKGRGRTLKSLNVPDGFEAATEFYKSARVDGAAQDGDGFAYSCSMPFRERGTRFELAFFRLFKSADGSFEPSRLRLSLCFNWVEVVRWLGRPDFGLPESNHYAWEPYDLGRLLEVVERDPTYLAIIDRPPKSVELRFEPLWGVYG